MPLIPVTFKYITGLTRQLWIGATLKGSWDNEGFYSQQWLETEMRSTRGSDGSFAFVATLNFNAQEVGSEFYWGVELHYSFEHSIWGIITEENLIESNRTIRKFRLLDQREDSISQEEVYCFNYSRWIGAQKWYKNESNSVPGIRFSLWAPNAASVEVCIPTLWEEDKDPQKDSLINKNFSPFIKSADRNKICGGFIADRLDNKPGFGSREGWKPYLMGLGPDGLWSQLWMNLNFETFTVSITFLTCSE